MQQGERACHPTRSNGGRAGMPSRDAWDPDTGPLRETLALPYRRFMKDAAMCRNLAFRRHANVDIFGDHAAATVTPDAPPGRGDCFAKKYRLVAATCHNSYKTIQKTIRPPLWRDAEPDAPPGRGDCFAKKYRLVAATCHNSYKTIQKTIRPPPWRADASGRDAGRAARKGGLFRQEISTCSGNVSQQLQNDTENNPAPAVAGCSRPQIPRAEGRRRCATLRGRHLVELAGGGAPRYAADTSLSWPVAQS